MEKLSKDQLDKTPLELGLCDREDCSYINFDLDNNKMICNRCSKEFEVSSTEKKTLKIVKVFKTIAAFISKVVSFILGFKKK